MLFVFSVPATYPKISCYLLSTECFFSTGSTRSFHSCITSPVVATVKGEGGGGKEIWYAPRALPTTVLVCKSWANTWQQLCLWYCIYYSLVYTNTLTHTHTLGWNAVYYYFLHLMNTTISLQIFVAYSFVYWVVLQRKKRKEKYLLTVCVRLVNQTVNHLYAGYTGYQTSLFLSLKSQKMIC